MVLDRFLHPLSRDLPATSRPEHLKRIAALAALAIVVPGGMLVLAAGVAHWSCARWQGGGASARQEFGVLEFTQVLARSGWRRASA